jgi:hypothetical protein
MYMFSIFIYHHNIRMDNTDFDSEQFNKDFDKNIKLQQEENNLKKLQKLNELNKEQEKPKLYEQSVRDTLIKMKDIVYELLDDILQGRFNKNTLTKNNRMYYVGIFLLIVVMLLHFVELVVHKETPKVNQPNIIEFRLVKD